MSDIIGTFLIFTKSGILTYICILIVGCYLVKKFFEYLGIKRRILESFRCEACHKGFYQHKGDYIFKCTLCKNYPSPLWKKRYTQTSHTKN